MVFRRALPLLLAALAGANGAVRAAPIQVVCAESVWCDVVRQVGGKAVITQALVVSPQVDPHDASPTPSMARAIASAQWLVVNGGGYDPWALKLAAASDGAGRQTLDVSKIVGAAPDANTHFFDDPALVEQVAQRVTTLLRARPDADQAALDAQAKAFQSGVTAIEARMAAMRSDAKGRRVAMTEPVGARMLDRLGITIVNSRMAVAGMHRSEPPARDVATVEMALSHHDLAFLVMNPAVTSPAMARLADRAKAEQVPVVTLTETPPAGESWHGWYAGRLDRVQMALASAADRPQ